MKFQYVFVVFIFLSLQIFFQSEILAVSTYEVGSKLYVLSEKGLNLRESASPESKKLVLLTYGSQVLVVNKYPTKEFKSDGISGKWVEVQFKSFKGFVFDGYLSNYIAPQKGCKNFKDYLTKNLGPGKKEIVSAGDYEGQTAIRFSKSILFLGEGGDTFDLFFPGISMEELYLIGKSCREIKAAKYELDETGAFSEIQGNLENRMYLDENGVVLFRKTM